MKTPVERKFFKISQFFFFVVTSISLVTAFGLGLYGLYLHNASPQERFTQPTPSYERLKRERAQAKAAVEQAKAQQQAPATPQGDKTPPANPEAIPAEYLDVLNSIEKSIVSFANKAQQLSPGNKLRFRIYKAATQYTAHFSVSSLLAQLDVEAKALEADADRIRALPQTAPDYITWALFWTIILHRLTAVLPRSAGASPRKGNRSCSKKRSPAWSFTRQRSHWAFLSFSPCFLWS